MYFLIGQLTLAAGLGRTMLVDSHALAMDCQGVKLQALSGFGVWRVF